MKRMCGALLVVLSAGSLAACLPPPFNLDLSLAAQTASRLTFQEEVGPIDSTGGFLDSSSANAAFYPERTTTGITTQAGFVLSQEPGYGQTLTFFSSNGGNWRQVGGTQSLAPVSSDPYPTVMVQAQKYGHCVVALQIDDTLPYDSTYAFAQGDPATGLFPLSVWNATLLQTQTMNDLGFGFGDWVVGMSISRAAGATDALNLLIAVPDNVTGTFMEAAYPISQAGPGSVVALRSTQLDLAGLGVLPRLPRYQYLYDPASGYGFAGWYNGAGWTCVKWMEAATPPGAVVSQSLPGMTHRPDAMLSNGQILSTEGDVGRLYDQSGHQLAQFPLTGLRYVGETDLGGVPQVLFSQAWRQKQRLYFNVFSMETARLSSLGK